NERASNVSLTNCPAQTTFTDLTFNPQFLLVQFDASSFTEPALLTDCDRIRPHITRNSSADCADATEQHGYTDSRASKESRRNLSGEFIHRLRRIHLQINVGGEDSRRDVSNSPILH